MKLFCLLVSVATITSAAEPRAAAFNETASRVFLNGRPTPVYFNDGDSFRVLGGPLLGTKARLAGFNTLESHGSVHRWGGWTAKELYWNAKLATLNARRGVWHCVSKDMAKDTYGRILWHCRDLAVDQIRKGFAHAMSVNNDPAASEFLAAQRDAIKNRRGMWAHGVPAYVLTSLHSVSEGGGPSGRTYNRVVSTDDGHSAKWRHNDAYKLCQWVCRSERTVSDASIDRAWAHLRADSDVAALGKKLPPAFSRRLIADYARLGYFSLRDRAIRTMLQLKLSQLPAELAFTNAPAQKGSCVLYVPFEQRFGRARASCLDH